jgi:hypothetical protein
MSKQRNTQAATAERTENDDPLLTLSEVGRAMNKSPQTIKRWVMDGLLRAVRLPSGLPAVRRSEVNKFLGGSALDIQLE